MNQREEFVLLSPHQTVTSLPYKFYASLPKVLGAQTVDAYYIESQDVVPELVHNYLKKYNSPMVDTSYDLVQAARKYELDPLLLVAIAQCESNLGKKMPHETENIYECHNPFGWGIHASGTLCFDTWAEGYETVAKGLKQKYVDQGLERPEDIMQLYTPASIEKAGGSWAKCVSKFLGQLNEMRAEL